MELFGKKLRKLRQQYGYTQSDLGKILGVSQVEICKYECGEHEPNFARLIQVSKHFKVTTDYLLGVNNKDYRKVGENYDETL